MRFSTISSIVRGVFLLDPGWAEMHAPLIMQVLAGEESGLFTPNIQQDDIIQVAANGYQVRSGSTGFSAPEGSVAVLNVNGPLVRYSEPCGAAGMEEMSSTIRAVNNNPSFLGGVLRMNCPGGEASGTSMTSDVLKGSSKPWLTCVDDGIAASGGMWLASSTREIFATNSQCSFGSIGAYCAFPDMKRYYESQGLKIHEVYSTLSKDKNKIFRDALNGDYTGLQAELDVLVNYFITSVKDGRGDRLNLSAGDPFTGKMYNTGDAQKIGIVDGIMSLEGVIARVTELANKPAPKNKPTTTNKTTMATEKKYPALANAAGWKTGYEVTEEGLHLNLESAAAVDTALAQGATDAATVAANTETITANEAKITELNGQMTSLTADRDQWKVKAEEYGAKPAVETKTVISQDLPLEQGNTKKYGGDETTQAAMKMFANRKK